MSQVNAADGKRVAFFGRATGASLLLAWLCLACGGAAPAELEPPAGVVLISVGNLRADAVGLEGPLAKVLPGAVRFERAYAPSSLEVQSAASLLVGRLPTRAGTVGVVESQPPEEAPTLLTRLRRQGWATGWIAQRSWGARQGFTRGADLVEVPSTEDWEASEVTRRALRALNDFRAAGSETPAPFFLAVHYAIGPGPRDLAQGPPDPSSYNDAAQAVLTEVGALAQATRGANLGSDRPLFVIVAGTNGYELGEHGGVGSAFTVREEAIRVPLLVDRGGAAEGAAVTAPVSTLDLHASIAALAGAAIEDEELDGSTLLGPSGEVLTQLPERGPLLAEVVVREWAIARAVIGERYKYIHAVREVPPADRPTVAAGLAEIQAAMTRGAVEVPPLFGDAVREELFDLDSDPSETSNRLEELAVELGPLRRRLRDYRSLCDATAFTPGEITERLDVDPSKMQELESLGYL